MASTTRPSGPGTAGMSLSSVVFMAPAMSPSARENAASSLDPSATFCPLAPRLFRIERCGSAAAGDLLDLHAGVGKLGLAVFAQRSAALIGLHRLVELDLTGFQVLHDLLEFFHGVFEVET